jgi:hypothetical protein
VADELAAAGITSADYAGILGFDPFANGATTIDTKRYVFMRSLPYQPPARADQQLTTTTFQMEKTTSASSISSFTKTHSVSVTASGAASFLTFVNANFSTTSTWTTTYDNAFSKTSGSSMSATADIMQPEFGYTGPVYLYVYLDTLFNTYMFTLR